MSSVSVISITQQAPEITVLSLSQASPGISVTSALVEGKPGSPGASGGLLLYTEALQGSIDGTNNTFSFSRPSVTELVFINGLTEDPDNYSITGTNITFQDAPEPGDKLRIQYTSEVT